MIECQGGCIVDIRCIVICNVYPEVLYSILALFLDRSMLCSQRCSSKTLRTMIIPQRHWRILSMRSRNSCSYSPGWTQEFNLSNRSVSVVLWWMGGAERRMANPVLLPGVWCASDRSSCHIRHMKTTDEEMLTENCICSF